MIKALGAVLMSVALLVFLSGASLAQTTKPEHPAKAEHPKAAASEARTSPKADPSRPSTRRQTLQRPSTRSSRGKAEHPKADPAKPDHPKSEHPK